jgi:hypothetical protein
MPDICAGLAHALLAAVIGPSGSAEGMAEGR